MLLLNVLGVQFRSVHSTMRSVSVLIRISLFLSLCFTIQQVHAKDVRGDFLNSCKTGLLKSLPESSFSASSVLRNESEFMPDGARMNTILETGTKQRAWCPNEKVTNRASEWLQVDFGAMKIINNMFTLGRDDGNYGEYVTSYYFDYQREDGTSWYRYRDDDRGEVMKGNNDARNPAHNGFASPLVARRVRIIPISSVPQMVCLKIFLYGCDFNDGVVEYRIPREINSDNNDDSYDGRMFSNQTWLQGGMGKLMDSVTPTNSSVLKLNKKDYKFYVAWNQEFQKRDHIEMIFRFDSVRKHRWVLLYPIVDPQLNLQQCRSLTIKFLKTEMQSSDKDISEDLPQSLQNFLQPINISLHNRLAKFVKIFMFFNSRRMGLHEIRFQSDPVDLPQPPYKPPDGVSTSPKNEDSSNLIINVTVISSSVVAFVIVLLLIIACILWIKQKHRRQYKNKLCDYRTLYMHDPSYPQNPGDINTISGKNPVYFRPNDGQIFGFSYVHPSYPPCQDYRAHSISNSNEYEPMDSFWPKAPRMNAPLLKDAAFDYNETQTLPANAGGSFQSHCLSSTYSSYPYDTSLPVSDIIPSSAIDQETFADIFNVHIKNPLKGLMGSSSAAFYLTPVSKVWIDAALSRLRTICSINISLPKCVSEGQIAQIRVGTIEGGEVNVVIAEMKLNQMSSEEKKYAFYRQCLLGMKDDFSSQPNLLPVIGQSKIHTLCTSIIYANPAQENVVSFFQRLRHNPQTNDVTLPSGCVSQGSLLFLMKQLADALAFLFEAGVVHRDVAARNCYLGHNFHLILSDFAIGLDEFQEDYVVLSPSNFHDTNANNLLPNAVQLPLLWMPWEAVINGNFSSKSDVWSFGVTLWEIFTECQLKPYSMTLPTHNDDPRAILQNCKLISHSHPSSILPNGRNLIQTGCTYDKVSLTDVNKQVRDIMHSCWQPNPDLRPNFHTLYSIFSEFNQDSRCMTECGTLKSLTS